MAVIYTGDIEEAPSKLVLDSLQLNIMQAFLSKFDTDGLYAELRRKVELGERLSDEDVIRFIILPLTEPTAQKKQSLIERAINLARDVVDEQQQIFIVAGILVATDKFINKEYSSMIKEWISMTKVARLFEEEKIEYANQAIMDRTITVARRMLSHGEDYLKVMDYTGLTKEEVMKIQTELSLSAANS